MGDEDKTPQGDRAGEPERDPVWKVEGEESMDSILEQEAPDAKRPAEGEGRMIYTDEQGRRRRIPAQRGAMSSGELRAAVDALRQDLGGPTADYARMAAIERLTELRASGKMSEEDFAREKKRLENYGR